MVSFISRSMGWMLYTKSSRGRRGRDRMCHRKCLSPLSYELKPRSWGGVLDTTLCLDDFVYSIQPIDLEIKDTIDMSKGLLHTLRLTMMAGWERNFTSQNIAAAHAYGYSSVYKCGFHQVGNMSVFSILCVVRSFDLLKSLCLFVYRDWGSVFVLLATISIKADLMETTLINWGVSICMCSWGIF
jgi:hypothetical protein